MKKRFFIAAVAVFAMSPVMGQQVFRFNIGGTGTEASSLEMARVERTELGEATLEITYDYNYVTDTLDRAKSKSDVMILQVGGSVSKFYSYNTFRADSLAAGAVSVDAVLADIGRYRGGENWVVYKNYPAGRLTLTDKIGTEHYLVEEEFAPWQWQVFDETRTIEGYTVQRAECDFRGRRWIAWFTAEIPLSEGPWKLSGLPGLILEAADSRGDHSFTLSGLRAVSDGMVTWPEHQYLKASRTDYLRTLRKFKENPLGMLSQGGTVVRVMSPDGKEITPTIEPMRYDFLESDVK